MKKIKQKYSHSKPEQRMYNSATNEHFAGSKNLHLNLEAFKNVDPELYQKLLAATMPENYILENTLTFPNLVSVSNGQHFYQTGNPYDEVEEKLTNLKLKNCKIAVIMGMGLGYELKVFLDRMSNYLGTQFILVIEKDIRLLKLALSVDNYVPYIQNLKVSFLAGVSENDFFPLMTKYMSKSNKFLFVKAMKPVYHIPFVLLDEKYYSNAMKTLREAVAFKIIEYGNSSEDSLLGIENMLANIHEIVSNPGVILLKDQFAGKPAVVVATGPSLDKNIALLREISDKALLIAADASWLVMKKIGVKPHLVVSLERTIGVRDLLLDLEPEDYENVFFAGCPVIDPAVYETVKSPRIIIYRSFDHFKWLGIDKGMINIKLSVGNMAFKVADYLGCNPILLIGQDLAQSDDGKTHASGTATTENGINKTAKRDFLREPIRVKGNVSQTVITSSTFYPCIKAYETDIAEYKGICVNCTEGGAFLQGSVVMPFQEAIKTYLRKPFDAMQIIRPLLNQFTQEDSKKDREKVDNLVQQTINDFKAIIELCEEGIKSADRYKEEYLPFLSNPARFDSIRTSAKEIILEIYKPRKKFAEYQNTFQLFLMHVIQSFFVQFTIQMNAIPEKYDDPEMAEFEIALQYREWYSKISEGSKKSLDLLLRTKKMFLTGKWEKTQANIRFNQILTE